MVLWSEDPEAASARASDPSEHVDHRRPCLQGGPRGVVDRWDPELRDAVAVLAGLAVGPQAAALVGVGGQEGLAQAQDVAFRYRIVPTEA